MSRASVSRFFVSTLGRLFPRMFSRFLLVTEVEAHVR